MSRKGDCWDNAVTETLFGSLKVERLHGMRFHTRRLYSSALTDQPLCFDSTVPMISSIG